MVKDGVREMPWKPTEHTENNSFITELYKQYSKLIFRVVSHYTRDPWEQEDIAQDAMERLVRQAWKLRKMQHEKVVAYMVFTLQSVTIDYFRKVKRRSVVINLEDYEGIPGYQSVEEIVLWRDELDRTYKVLDQLKNADRLALMGRYQIGLNKYELADLLGCTPESVDMRVKRAKDRVNQKLKEEITLG